MIMMSTRKKEVKLDYLTNLEKHSTKNPISRLFLDNFLKTVVATVKPLGVKSILDVGCGEGFTLSRLKREKFFQKLEGIDAVKEAVAAGQKLHPDLTFKLGDIYRLAYKDDSFDILLCTEVLEHLGRPTDALKELIRVSKKYILVTVPNEPWFTISRILRGKNLLKLGAHPEHIQWWTSNNFQRFVSKQKGVKIRVIKHPTPWTMILLEKRS
jgi:ubiquinone/menaquinone biosynthesis C-methylase UbiE